MNGKKRINVIPNSCKFCMSWDEIKHASFIEFYGRYGNCHECGKVKSANDLCRKFTRY